MAVVHWMARMEECAIASQQKPTTARLGETSIARDSLRRPPEGETPPPARGNIALPLFLPLRDTGTRRHTSQRSASARRRTLSSSNSRDPTSRSTRRSAQEQKRIAPTKNPKPALDQPPPSQTQPCHQRRRQALTALAASIRIKVANSSTRAQAGELEQP